MRLTSSLAPHFCGKKPRKKCCLSNVPMLYTATSAVASSLYLSELSGRKESGFGIGFKKNNQFFPIVFQKISDCSDYGPFK